MNPYRSNNLQQFNNNVDIKYRLSTVFSPLTRFTILKKPHTVFVIIMRLRRRFKKRLTPFKIFRNLVIDF